MRNATLGTALGRLQRMRETQEWRVARDMPKGKARTKAFSAVHKAFGLTEFGLTIIANNHRKASGRKDIGAHEAQSIGKAVWRALQRHMFRKAGRPLSRSALLPQFGFVSPEASFDTSGSLQGS